MIPSVFHHLEVLVLRPPSLEPTDEEAAQELSGQCAYNTFRSPGARRVAATEAMKVITTLKRIDFGIQSEIHRFLREEHGIEESSVPVEEGYDRHDFDWICI